MEGIMCSWRKSKNIERGIHGDSMRYINSQCQAILILGLAQNKTKTWILMKIHFF